MEELGVLTISQRPHLLIILVIVFQYTDSGETGTFRKQHKAMLQIIYFHLSPITNL